MQEVRRAVNLESRRRPSVSSRTDDRRHPPCRAPEQAEMPFAIVDGEPVTELPRDLYIPPQALKVFLEAFEGPLDLLLYLIRRQNLDILDIPIAEITRQYTRVHRADARAAARAGRRVPADGGDARRDQVADAAAAAARARPPRRRIRAPSWCAGCRSTSASSAPPRTSTRCRASSATLCVGQRRARSSGAVARARCREVTLKEMLVAFKDVIQRAAMFAHHHVQRERLSVRQRMSEIIERLQGGELRRVRAPVPRRGGPHGRRR